VERLRRRIVGLLITGAIRREFRQYARLLRTSARGLVAEIERRVDRSNPYVMRYLAYLRRMRARQATDETRA